MKTLIRISLLAIPLLLAACSNAKPLDARPDWVTGNSAAYPSSAYLTGRGDADILAVAQDRARADLAKTFSVNVSEQSSDVSAFSQNSSGAASGAKNSLDVSRNISTRTDAVLQGVVISDTWLDPQSHVYHVLATLSRSKASAALRQQISNLDAGTSASLNAAQGSTDLFDKIAAASQAVDAQQTRTGLQRALQVVDITGQGIPPQWPLAKLQADRTALLKQLQISAAADGRNADGTKKILAGSLADAGFTVADVSPYTMTASLDYSELKPQNGWYWITGTLQVSLTGTDTHAHGVRRWDLKVSGTDPQLAEQRVMDQVAQYLQSDIQATVLDFASGKGSAQQP
ncbi:MAG: LPP20 family lipoprotein [Gammaproteobacteria bacterium]